MVKGESILIWHEILCLGDSLTYGARDRYGRGYPAELAQILSIELRCHYVCHNYGINGETSSDLLRRHWGIIKGNKACQIMLLMIGTNDTKIPMPIDIYSDNIRQIVNSARANGMTPIVATLPALRYSPHYQANRKYIGRYNDVIYELSKKLRFKVCCMEDLGHLLIDGVHFDNKGYRAIATKWAETILEDREDCTDRINHPDGDGP